MWLIALHEHPQVNGTMIRERLRCTIDLNEHDEVKVVSICVVCRTEVEVAFDLSGAVILCEDCTLRNVSGAVVKYHCLAIAEQERIREQGREACFKNAICFATESQMPHFNPYETFSEEWQLWKEGYFEALERQA
jgi:hypothetical protein